MTDTPFWHWSPRDRRRRCGKQMPRTYAFDRRAARWVRVPWRYSPQRRALIEQEWEVAS